jgi:hypothetical protein
MIFFCPIYVANGNTNTGAGIPPVPFPKDQ